MPVIIIDTSALLLNTALSSLYVHATIIEKAAIGLYLESLLNRRGLHGRSVARDNTAFPNKITNHLNTAESTKVLQDFAEVQATATVNLSGQSTRSFLSKQLGFGNHESYRQARQILLEGDALLIHSVNQKHVALHAAVKIMKLPTFDQINVINRLHETNNVVLAQTQTM